MKKITLVILFFTLFWSQITHAADRNVPGDYATIAAAITAASDGDRIVIATGVYTTTAALNPGDKSLTFLGADKATTIIQSNTDGSITNAWPVFNNSTAITANRTYNFSNLTIKNGYSTANGGGLVFSTGTSFTLTLNFTDVNITGNQTTGNSIVGGAFYLAGNINPTFTNCYFYNNKTKYNGGGGAIYIASGANTLNVNNCYFLSNQTGAKGGGAICSASTGAVSITIKNSTFKSNLSGLGTGSNKGGAICLTPGTGATSLWVENSTFNLNTAGYLTNATQAGLGGAIFYQSGASTSNSITLNHCTITGNIAKTNPGVTGGGDGVCVANASTNAVKLIINNSIIIGNTGSSVNTSDVGTDNSSQTKISTVGVGASTVTNSIIGVYDSSWGVTTGETTSNYNYNNKTNAVVGDLVFGTITTDSTPVIPIGVTSIARNYLVTEKLSPALSTDQIGQSRMFKPDAGAYESQSPVFLVSLTAGANGTVSTPTGGWGGGYFDDANTGIASKYSATITATPNPTYEFEKWTDGVGTTVSTSNPYTFNVTANTSLTANFKVSAVPTISATPSTLSGFGYAPGSGPSSEKSFLVSGLNLTTDISITAPTDYEVSTTSGSGFGSSTSVSFGSGTVTNVPVYVRLNAGLSAATAYNSENITLTSDGAVSKTVSCSGNVYAAAPTTAATTAVASNVLHTTATLSWTAGDADKYLVVYSTNSDVATAHLPVGGTTYTAGQTLASGYTIGYAGTGTTADITGLTAGTTMYFAVFGYNDKYVGISTSGYENYLTTTPATTSATTIVASSVTDYFRSRATGTWATATTWESSVNGTNNWHIASAAPTSSATSVSVQDGFTVIVDAATTIPATTVDATSTLKATAAITAGSTLVVNGTYEHAIIPAAIATSITTPVTTWSVGSTLLISTQYPSTIGGSAVVANNQVQSFGGSGYQNVTFNVNIPVADAFIALTAIINGKLKVIATGIGGLVTTAIDVTAGSYEQTGGVVIGNRNSDINRGIAVLGDATISGGTLNVRYNYNNTKLAGPANFKVGGNLTISGGTITNGASGSNSPSTTLPIIEFTKNGTQTYTNSGVAFTNGIAVLVDATSILDMGTSTFAGTGSQASTFSTASGATLLIANASGANAYFGSNITPTFSNAKLVYNGSEAQVTGSLATSINNLEVSNTSGVSLSANTTTSSLLINSGSILTVPAANQLTVSTTMTNNGTIRLNSGSSGTATVITPSTISGAGTATVEQYLPTGRNWYVGMPISDVANIPYTSLTAAGASSVSYWDEANGVWLNGYTGNLLRGRGYIAVSNSGTATSNISFSGTLNTGDVTLKLTRTAGKTKEGFNLVANPYPSYLNPCALISSLSDSIESTIWYRTKPGAYSFETVNTGSGVGTNGVTGYIPPMQAFWVRVKPNLINPGQNNGATLTFTNTMRYHSGTYGAFTTTTMKAPSMVQDKMLRLTVSNGINTDETVIYTNANASNGYDVYDSNKMSNDNVVIPELYTVIGSNNIVINGFNQLPVDQEIPLGFKAGQSDGYTIKATQISNLEEGTILVLKDKLMNIEHELTEGAEVVFSSDAVNTTSRFSVILKTNGSVTGTEPVSDLNNSWSVIVNKNAQLVISGIKRGSMISVFNATGQKITEIRSQSQSEILHGNYNTGVYIVAVNNQVKKVIIK